MYIYTYLHIYVMYVCKCIYQQSNINQEPTNINHATMAWHGMTNTYQHHQQPGAHELLGWQIYLSFWKVFRLTLPEKANMLMPSVVVS